MTTDELRDRLAKALGWQQIEDAWDTTDGQHPLPPNDLNALAAVWREELKGWSWARWGDGVWIAQPPGVNPKLVEVPDTGDEYHDRLALTLACVEAERGKK